MFIKYRKSLIKRELEIYREEELQKIERELIDLKKLGIKQLSEFEHDYHSQIEERKKEIAILEAKKESYKSILEERNSNYVQEYQAVNRAKDKTIEVLQKTIEELSKRIPEVKVIGVK
jgi:hypothetical protein